MNRGELVEWCRRLIACRSLTREGTREIAALCAGELLAPAGIKARLIPSPAEGDSQVNLVAAVKGEDSALAPILLNTHLDTVPPGDSALWTACGGDPFNATIDGDRIYGLGTSDTKLDFVAKAAALAEVGRPRRDVWLVATFGEEHGLIGAKEIVAAGIVPRGALAFVGEPSMAEVVTAHKGIVFFHLELRFEPAALPQPVAARRAIFLGRSAHSSTPALGSNAILAALGAIADYPRPLVASISGGDAVNKVAARCELTVTGDAPQLAAIAAQIEPAVHPVQQVIPRAAIAALTAFISHLSEFANRNGPPEPGYASPTLTWNPGVIRSTDNSIVLEFELRPPPSMSIDTVRAGVNQAAGAIARLGDGVTVDLVERRANPGFRSPESSATVALATAALAAAALPIKTAVKTGCTEAGIYAAAGLEPVVFGPGMSAGVIHAPNEYNLISQVEGATRFYRAILRS
ncbi:MAG TPA: M20/M25/M40 family metallo-hydrolase [Candidatus Binataceae bacterium]|nr:M20/M25/M40 family metallo-hydrolase [Candidatus Binataceae bacterium]